MSMTHSDNDLLTPLEAAEILKVAPSTLVRWRRHTRRDSEQYGPYWVELGRNTVAYRRGTLNDFIASRERRANG